MNTATTAVALDTNELIMVVMTLLPVSMPTANTKIAIEPIRHVTNINANMKKLRTELGCCIWVIKGAILTQVSF